MKIQLLNCILYAVFIVSNVSCRMGGRCEEPATVYQSSITVDFKDAATGKYLYTESFPLYDKDSLAVLDPNSRSLAILSSLNQIPNTSERYWALNFRNLYDDQTDAISFSSEICKNYIIKYTYNEMDTVQVCFKAKKTPCGSIFETLKVFNKGQQIGASYGATFAQVTITKN